MDYGLSARYWPDQGIIRVEGPARIRICTIPLGSLIASNDANWDYVLYCIRRCVEDPQELGELFNADASQPIDYSTTVKAGSYVYKLPSNDEPLTLKRGPIGKRRGRPALSNTSDTYETISNSSRSTTRQANFRVLLGLRDTTCLISGVKYEMCTASHIVPFSRSDIYDQILGYDGESKFLASMGILLSSNLHHAYDRYEISIFPRENDYVVHVFIDITHDLMEFHGKTFDCSRFHRPPDQHPDPRFLKWQHQQCVQKHYRGFAVRMSAQDETW